MLVVKPHAGFNRLELVTHLESKGIGTRNLFTGNLLKHPAYKGKKNLRVAELLNNSDIIMNNGFWIGVWPGITDENLAYIKTTITEFMRNYLSKA